MRHCSEACPRRRARPRHTHIQVTTTTRGRVARGADDTTPTLRTTSGNGRLTNSESPARWLPAPSRTPASSGVRSAGRRGLQRRHLGWDFTRRELRGLKGGVGTLEKEYFLATSVFTAKYLLGG